jgi:hypothetical protein
MTSHVPRECSLHQQLRESQAELRVINHREATEVTVYAAEIMLISLANVFAESTGDTEAAEDQYLVIIRTRRSYPTSTYPGTYRVSTPGSSGKRSLNVAHKWVDNEIRRGNDVLTRRLTPRISHF